MTQTQEEFTKAVYEIIKDKVFFSNISKEIADVVEKLPAAILPGKVLFDGLNLFDGIEGIEDDIQQMNSFTKDGERVNLEDYYTDNGAFEDDGKERFLAALERLMTKDDFIVYLKDYYLLHLKALIEEDEEIATREEDEFDREFVDDEYVQCISMAEGRARATGKIVHELETFLKKIDC